MSEKLYGFLVFSEKSANGREGHGTWSGDRREETGKNRVGRRKKVAFFKDFR